VMKLVWFLITVPTKTEPSTKPSTAHHELDVDEWRTIYNSCFFSELCLFEKTSLHFYGWRIANQKNMTLKNLYKSTSYYIMCALY
jgi:hypothetical protein